MTKAEAQREADLNVWIIRKFRKLRADEVRNEQKRIERQKEKHKGIPWLISLCEHLANQLHQIGDQFDITARKLPGLLEEMKMKMTLIEKTGQSRIMCSIKNYPRYKSTIKAYIALYGGEDERRNAMNKYYH